MTAALARQAEVSSLAEVRLADCLDPLFGMPMLPDRSVDVFISDPPYSPKVHDCSRRGLTDYKERKGAGARDRRKRDLEFEPLDPAVRLAVAQQIARLVRRWGLIFSDLEGVGIEPGRDARAPDGAGWLGDLVRSGLEYVRTGIWRKIGSTPQLTGDRPGNGVEAIIIVHQMSAPSPRGIRRPIKKRWNGGGLQAIWEHPIVLDRGHDGGRVHTTQKPLSLMKELVEQFSEEGDLVLDPFAGSGTTGIACRKLGRAFLGFEKEAKWAELAQRRVAGERAVINECQPELF